MIYYKRLFQSLWSVPLDPTQGGLVILTSSINNSLGPIESEQKKTKSTHLKLVQSSPIDLTKQLTLNNREVRTIQNLEQFQARHVFSESHFHSGAISWHL